MTRAPGRWARDGGFYVAAGVVYVLLTLYYFWPVLAQLETHLIGDGGDNLMFAWNAWWLRQAIATGQNPYFCPLQFAPEGVPLVLHTFGLLPTSVVALLSTWLGLSAAYNLVVMGQFPLAGLCGCALAYGLVRHRMGALAAGVVFMLCPFFASKTAGHFNLQWAAILPLYMLSLLRGLRAPTGRWRLAITATYIAILLGNVHTVIFAANVTFWCFLYRGVTRHDWRGELHRFWRLLWPTLAVTAAWGAFVLTYAVRYELEAKTLRSLLWMPEPLNYALPLYVTSYWRPWLAPPNGLRLALENLELAVYVGWTVLPLAIVGWWALRRRRVIRVVIALFVAALVISMGTKLQWLREPVRVGGVAIPLPYQLYEHVPILGVVGQTGRYFIIGYAAMAVGVGAAIRATQRRWGRRAGRAAAVAIILLVSVDYAFVPPQTPLPQSPIPPGTGRVMDPRLGNTRSLFYQTQHGRELVGGYIARIPEPARARYEQLGGLGWFFRRPPERRAAPTPAQIRQDLRRMNIRYVIVAGDGPEAAWLRAAGLLEIARTGSDVVLQFDEGE